MSDYNIIMYMSSPLFHHLKGLAEKRNNLKDNDLNYRTDLLE